MSCQLILDPKGNIEKVFASNGQESNLFKQLTDYYQGNKVNAFEKWIELNNNKSKLNLDELDINGEPIVNSDLYFAKDTSAIENFYANEGQKRYADNKSTYNTVLRRLKKEYPSLANDIYGKKVSSGGGYSYKFAIRSNPEQKSSTDIRPSDNVLNQKLKTLLEGIGVKTDYLENSRFKDLPALGVADMFSKIAYVSMNRSRIDTLPEESSHFFVEFLEQTKNPLFAPMMSAITSYSTYMETYQEYRDTYKLPNGTPDVYKIKKEAIGKVIAKIIVDKNNVNESQNLLQSFTNWFNKVLDAIKNKLASIGLINEAKVEDYFGIAATNIMSGEYTGELNSQGIFLQLSDKQKPLDSIIDERDSQIRTVKKTDGEESIKEIFKDGKWQYIKRVSEVVKDKKVYYNNADTLTDIQKESAKNKAEFGTKVHNDLMILLNKALGKEDNRPYMLNSAYHEKLENFVDSIIEQFNPETHSYYTEINIHNNKLAGTLDLLIVDANGKANIFDYKSVTRLLDINLGKSFTDKWYEQLTQYKNILRDYGIKEFGQTRVIPIAVNFTDKVTAKPGTERLDYFQIGTNKFDAIDENLNPVPLPEERTGIKTIDSMIEKINDRIRQLATRPSQENTYKINELRKDIAKLQVSQDLDVIKNQATVDLAIVQNLIAKSEEGVLDESEIKELLDLYEYYEGRLKENLGFNKKGDIIEEIVATTAYVQEHKNKIDTILQNYNNSQDVTETTIKPSTWWNRIYKLSDYDIPAFQGLYKLLNKAFAQKEIRVGKIKDEVTEIINQIKQETGITDSKMFYPILQKDKDGKPNGKLLAQKTSAWFTFVKENKDSIYKQLDSTSISYLKNSPLGEYLDLEKLQEYFTDRMNTKLETLKTSEDSYKLESIKRYKKYLLSITVGNPNSKFYNTTNPNFTKFINPEYKKYIQDAPNSGLAKIYKKFIELNQYANENADANIRHTNLLPYIRKNTVKNLIDTGFNLRKLKDNVLNDLQTQEWESFELDSNGQKIYKIPLKYNTDERKRDLSQQSLDLGEVLVLWADAVYGNELMQKHHDTSLLFLEGLKRSKEFVTRNGNLVTKNGTIATKLIEENSETIQQYIEYHNDAFYGQTSKDEDAEILGMSRRKLARAATQYFSGTQLALNIFSGLSNLTGGLFNATTYAGNQYNNKQYGLGLKSIFSRDSKTYAAIKMFNVDSNIYDANQFKDVSVDKVNKFFTWDKVYFLQKKGDWLMQNATLVAMMQNYTIKEDRIVKKTDADKNLLELIQMNDKGQYKLPLENEEELFRFREKVRNVNSQIIGNTSEYDKQLAGNTLLFQLALQFRRWMLPMGVSRFGSLKYNSNLEEIQYGKYRSTGRLLWETAIKKGTLMPLLEFVKKTENGVLDTWLLEQYNKDLIQNPQLGSFADYRDLYHRNIKSTAMEATVLLGLVALKMALKADDDEEVKPWQKVLTRVLSRTTAENSFWFSADSFFQIVQTPIPIVKLVKSVTDLLELPADAYASIVEDDETAFDNYDVKAGKLVIGYNAWLSFLKEIDKNE